MTFLGRLASKILRPKTPQNSPKNDSDEKLKTSSNTTLTNLDYTPIGSSTQLTQNTTLAQTGSSLHGSQKTSVVQTTLHGVGNVLQIVSAASDAFPPLKSVIGGILAIIKTYEEFSGNKDKAIGLIRRLEGLEIMQSSNETELRRRTKLLKALEIKLAELRRISTQNVAERLANSSEDNKAISECMEDIRDALTDYQVSMQQDLLKMQYQTIEKVDILLLEKLPCAKNAGHLSGNRTKCLRGTRIQLLDDVNSWAETKTDKPVYWMSGPAGSGKSTITQSFAETLFAEGRLGASFFCSREFLDTSNMNLIFPTLAHDLAYRYHEFRQALIPVITSDPNLGHESLSVQLEKLLIGPLQATNLETVIIIDALDECKDDQQTSAILSLLSRRISEIPSLKLFITSRPEPHIRSAFRLPLLRPHLEVLLLQEVERISVDQDIETFLKTRLPEIVTNRSDVDLDMSWPADEDIKILVRKSSGLFIFASTTYKFIASGYDNPDDRLRLITSMPDSTSYEGLSGVDQLYARIFDDNYEPGMPNYIIIVQRLHSILGAVIVVFNPLSRTALAILLGIKPSEIATSLRPLHSLLLVPESEHKPIRVYHKSFPDYLVNPARCTNPQFHVDKGLCHAKLAICCLQLMKEKLRKNICDLPRYAMNADVEDLPARRKEHIGDALEYACVSWAKHLRASVMDDPAEILSLLRDFSRDHLLSWLEVLSLSKELRVAVYSFEDVKFWMTGVQNPDMALMSWIEDGKSFTLHFYDLIQESAAHIYHSALPLSPKSTYVRAHYQSQATGEVEVLNGLDTGWDGCIRAVGSGSMVLSVIFSHQGHLIAAGGHLISIFETATGVRTAEMDHGGVVLSTSFSPDDQILASGCYDYMVRIWDIGTGELGQTLKGHTGSVHSVVFSPDGTSIASGSGDHTIRIWDASSGSCKVTLFGHDDGVSSVSWFNGSSEILSGSRDGTVKIWDAATGFCIRTIGTFDPDNRAPVWSVAAAPDSSLIIAGFATKIATVYNAKTGDVVTTVGAPGFVPLVSFSSDGTQILYTSELRAFVIQLQPEFTRIATYDCGDSLTLAAAFSPINHLIVSGTARGLLKIWNADWRSSANYSVDQVAIRVSPDGRLVASTSSNGSVRLWSSVTAKCLHSFMGEAANMSILEFSPDSRLLAAATKGGTVMVWDVESHDLCCTLEDCGDYIDILLFSPDCSRIVTQSWNGKLMLWKLYLDDGSTPGQSVLAVKDLGYRQMTYRRAVFCPDETSFILVTEDGDVDKFNIVAVEHDDGEEDGEENGDGDEDDAEEEQDGGSVEDEQDGGSVEDEQEMEDEESEYEYPMMFDPVPEDEFSYEDPTPLYRFSGDGWVTDQHNRRICWVPPARQDSPHTYFGSKIFCGTKAEGLLVLDLSPTLNLVDI